MGRHGRRARHEEYATGGHELAERLVAGTGIGEPAHGIRQQGTDARDDAFVIHGRARLLLVLGLHVAPELPVTSNFGHLALSYYDI